MFSEFILNDCKIFVIHAPTGYEFQGQRVTKLLAKQDLDFEFIHEESAEHLNELVNKYCDPDLINKFRKGGIACTVSHILALEKFLETGKKFALIFEDDPCFLGDFTSRLNKHTNEIHRLEEGFIISLENTNLKFPSFFQTKKNKHLYQASMGRMACAYLVDIKGAQNALNDLKTNKCGVIIDWWHNSLIKNKVIRLYWLHPPLVEQGSINGKMNSTISSRPHNIRRRISWLLQKAYKMTFRRLFKEKRVISS